MEKKTFSRKYLSNSALEFINKIDSENCMTRTTFVKFEFLLLLIELGYHSQVSKYCPLLLYFLIFNRNTKYSTSSCKKKNYCVLDQLLDGEIFTDCLANKLCQSHFDGDVTSQHN